MHPDLGTLEDLDELIAEAGAPRHPRAARPRPQPHERPPRLVPGRARRPRRPAPRLLRVGRPGDGGRPTTGSRTSAARRGRSTRPSGQYYLAQFLPTQPDLNWWSEDVREAFDDVLRFWFDRGIAGFRIDVCHAIVKDRELRDDPLRDRRRPPEGARARAQAGLLDEPPELHDVLRRWRALTAERDPSGSSWGRRYVLDLDQLIPSTAAARTSCTWRSTSSSCTPTSTRTQMRPIVEGDRGEAARGAWPVWTGSNHDAGRLATRWAGGDERKARAALMMLLTLRGTPFLYYGDEIGLTDVQLDPASALDPVPHRTGDPDANRDVCRTPMPWSDEPGAGLHRRRRGAVAPDRRPAARNVAASARTRARAAPRARPDRAAARARGPARRRLRDARAGARRARGRGGAATDDGGAQPVRRAASRSAWTARC